MSGDASTQVDIREVSVVGQGGAATSRPLFVMPEIVVETRVGQWDVGGGVGMLFIPSEGPDTAHEELVVYSNDCGPTQPGSAACAPAYGGISNARAYGPLWLLVPQVSARMVF